jgi:nucleoside-diphosphate-sugar epimerase
MRVFVTGATGFIGSAVVKELLTAGHQVLGLARSDDGAKLLKASGAEVHRGSLEDLDSLRRGAAAADAVAHLGFVHNFNDYATSVAIDLRAIETLGAALAGSNRPLIVTSGTLIASAGRVALELHPSNPNFPRKSEDAAHALVAQGVRASIMRLPPSVHGEGDHGFVPMIIGIARAKGVSAYIGDGLNRWPSVHRFDAAKLYRLVLEKNAAASTYHAVDDEGVPTREIAEVIGRRLGLPVVSKSQNEAPEHFGWMARFFGTDGPASSAITRERTGWRPVQPSLIADMEAYYFEQPTLARV